MVNITDLLLRTNRELRLSGSLRGLTSRFRVLPALPTRHLLHRVCSLSVLRKPGILYTIQKALSLNVYQILNSPLRCTFLESAVFHPGLGQITCKSPANHLQITCKSPANHLQITCKSPANHPAIVAKYPSETILFQPKNTPKDKKT